MFAQNPASGNRLVHLVGIVIPYGGDFDDPIVHFAGRNMSAQFGLAGGSYDASTQTIVVFSIVGELSELDMTRVMGIALEVARDRDGVAVVIDDDLIMI